jgi:ubiquinone/menaquinone biosynthesis C-methylase UbiE
MILYHCEIKVRINGKIAKEFTKYMLKYPNLYKNLAITIFKEINSEIKNPIILDLGSGPGLLNREVKKIIPNSVIISLDPSIKMLKNAEKYHFKSNTNRINGILSIAENIPLKSNSVDILVSRFSLSYWKKPKNAISEINRVLKPGGKFVLETLNKNFPKWKLFLIKIHMSLNFAGSDVIKYHSDAYKNAYDINEIKNLLNNSDLKIIKKEGFDRDWKYKIVAKKLNISN